VPTAAAFIGLGRVHKHYCSLISNGMIPEISIVAVCDKNVELVAMYSKVYSCLGFDSFQSLIESTSLDLVIILTPSGSHYEHAKFFLERGINVLVEKPISMLISQAISLQKLSLLHGAYLGVIFQNRYNPAIRALKKAFQKNRFGKIITSSVRLRWCRLQEYYEDCWHGRWLTDGGVINQQAIHHIDAMQWILGPVDSVCGTYTNRLNFLEAEDTFAAVLIFHDGSLGTIEATTAARPKDMEASFSIVGEKGYASIGGIALNEVCEWVFDEPYEEDTDIISCNQLVPSGYGLGHIPLLKNVCSYLQKDESSCLIELSSAIYTTILVHSLYRSCEIGGWVSVGDKMSSAQLGRNSASYNA